MRDPLRVGASIWRSVGLGKSQASTAPAFASAAQSQQTDREHLLCSDGYSRVGR